MKIDLDVLNEFKMLDRDLYRVQCKNWIESKGNGSGASGKTLEEMLGKLPDRDVLPDYRSIELKTRNINSKYPLHLFSCALDNKPLEMKRLLSIGGYPDKNNPDFKSFMVRVDAISNKKMGRYLFRLNVNNKNEVIELLIMYSNGVIFDKMSWSFRELRSRLERKLKYLALVWSMSARAEGKTYFKYYDANYYTLRGFDTFLSLVEAGSITVSFKLTHYHSGEHYGEYLDKGTGFEIREADIPLLFEPIVVEH